jgi:hypothetical protein
MYVNRRMPVVIVAAVTVVPFVARRGPVRAVER